MSRPITGSVVKPTPKHPCFALRFSAYGKRRYITLGRPQDGWTEAMAERELAIVLREVELSTWQPPQPQPAQPPQEDVYFVPFSAEWLDAKVLEIEENTASSYRNDLRNHLVPFFKEHLVTAIDVKEIDRYRQHKVAQAQAHVRLDPCGDRQGPQLRDGAARPHRPGVHAARLHAHDAPQRR